MTSEDEHASELLDERALHEALGRFVVSFSSLEFTLAHAVGILIGSEETVGQTVAATMSFQMLLDTYCSLLLLRADQAEATEQRLDALRTALAVEEQYRNTVVHSFWQPDLPIEEDGDSSRLIGSHLRLKMSSRGGKGMRVAFEFVDPATIDNHVNTLNRLTGNLMDLLPRMPRVVSRRRRLNTAWGKPQKE
jgi:hypothetical protein